MRGNRILAAAVGATMVAACVLLPRPTTSNQAVANFKPAKPELPALTAFMRVKLAASQDILEGLTTEDFGKIEKGALRLQAITVAEEWRVSDDQNYLDHSAEFRRILGRLKTSAANKSLDGTALNYVEMTMSCVRCHKDLRTAGGNVKPKE